MDTFCPLKFNGVLSMPNESLCALNSKGKTAFDLCLCDREKCAWYINIDDDAKIINCCAIIEMALK